MAIAVLGDLAFYQQRKERVLEKTYNVLGRLKGRKNAEALAKAFENLTPKPIAVGFFEQSEDDNIWEIEGYFNEYPNEIELALLTKAYQSDGFTLSIVVPKDWVAQTQNALHPIQIGRFFLHGSHDRDKIPPSYIPLLIDAATAFGTGHHDTTRACLYFLDILLTRGQYFENIADIGTGTGVLAMAAAKSLTQAKIYACDIDPIAVDVAQENFCKNNLENRVEIFESSSFSHPILQAHKPYDLIFANILKKPLIALAKEFYQNLHLNGVLILSGILNTQSESVIAAYETQALYLKDRCKFGKWECLLIGKNKD